MILIKTLVTGGAGFIGSHISEKLLEDGHEVGIIDDFSTGEQKPKGANIITGSILDKDTLSKAFQDVEIVFHQAAQVSVPESVKNPEFTKKVNVEGTKNVLDMALRKNVKKVIFASSAAIYPDVKYPVKENEETDPQNPYGESKKEAEDLMHAYSGENGLETVCLRYFNVYGPRQQSGVVSIFLKNALGPKIIKIYGDGKQTRDFIHVSDVVRANMKAAFSKTSGESFNIATGKGTALLDLVSAIEKTSGKTLKLEFNDEREGDIRYSCAIVSKAEEVLGFKAAVGLEDGLRKTFSMI